VAEPGRRGHPARYDVAALRRWRAAKARAGTGVVSLEQARTRNTLAQAERTELQNRLRRGELIEVTEVWTVWTEILSALRVRLMSLPSALTAELARESEPKVIFRLLTAGVHDALAECARWRPPEPPSRTDGAPAGHVHPHGTEGALTNVSP
jgi:hypothetical protein